jgi:prepilin-type N-terminal cleavage/methylation domain-containing protein
MWAKHKNSGFTIVELLIVIVIIAILAAITIVAYNGIQNRAKASAVASDFKKIEKGLRLLATEQGLGAWWIDNTLNGTPNPTINSLVADTDLKKYMQSLSNSTGTENTWIYDNDGDTYTGCSAASTGGVNIYAYNMDLSVAQLVDNSIDDGNLTCGNVTISGTTLRYNFGRAQSL